MRFGNPIVAGVALIREAIQSPNYVAGVSGWSINRDGTAEFADFTARGTLQAGPITSRVDVNDEGLSVTSDNGTPGIPGIKITTTIPPDILTYYAAQGINLKSAIIYTSDVADVYWYEAVAGYFRVRGFYFPPGSTPVTETSREGVGLVPPLVLRERISVNASGTYTPVTTTPTLLAGTETIIGTLGYAPLTVSWECTYTADMEQVSGSNTSTVVALYVDGVYASTSKQLIFNPGNTSTSTPAQRHAGLSSTHFGTFTTSAIPSSIALYGWRAVGTGSNRINQPHTGYTLKLYY